MKYFCKLLIEKKFICDLGFFGGVEKVNCVKVGYKWVVELLDWTEKKENKEIL